MFKTLGEVYASFIEGELCTSKIAEERSKPTEIETLRTQVSEAKAILSLLVKTYESCRSQEVNDFLEQEYLEAVEWLDKLEM